MTARVLLSTAVATGLLVLTGCGGSGATGSSASGSSAADPSKPSVVAAFYPLQYAAEQVGGDTINVTNLTPPGVEPHDLELTAAQVAQIAGADLVLYVKGFQPAIDEAIVQQAADHAIDVSSLVPLLGEDPHVWLDPANMATIGGAIGDRLSEVEPAKASTLDANAAKFQTDMGTLGKEFATGLATCRSRDLVVSHEAFGYLANAYAMTQVGISGLSPDAEPSPARMKEVADLVTSKAITTIYYESLVDPKVAQTIADETGATAAKLDPLEGLVEGATGDFGSIMRENLSTLRAGQGCT